MLQLPPRGKSFLASWIALAEAKSREVPATRKKFFIKKRIIQSIASYPGLEFPLVGGYDNRYEIRAIGSAQFASHFSTIFLKYFLPLIVRKFPAQRDKGFLDSFRHAIHSLTRIFAKVGKMKSIDLPWRVFYSRLPTCSRPCSSKGNYSVNDRRRRGERKSARCIGMVS